MFNIFRGIHTGALPPLTAEEVELSLRLREHVHTLALAIGDRNAPLQYANLKAAEKYIEQSFAKLGFTTTDQIYPAAGKDVRNIDTEICGASKPDEIVIVGAHYDSIPGCPAANDNASGVAAMLEIARLLKPLQLARTVRFVAFVNEEPPWFQTELMGSRVYAKRCRERGEKIVAMITPETIGCYSDEHGTQSYPFPLRMMFPDVGNFIAFIGNGASKALVDRVTESFRKSTAFPAVGFAAPGWITQAGWSDHWSFWQEGYHALMATDTAPLRYRCYHTPEDTPDKIDFDRTARVVAGLARVVKELALTP